MSFSVLAKSLPVTGNGLALAAFSNIGIVFTVATSGTSRPAAPGNFEETSFGAGGDAPGLAGVWASELSRGAIFEALWNRRTYAVSGSRTFLDSKVNGNMMGDEFALSSADQRRDVRIVIAGTSSIKRVELIHNNMIAKRWAGNKKWDMELGFQHTGRLEGLTADVRTNYYYVRVLQDNGHMAWSGPVWVNVSG